jgi:hypothetical protein
VVTRLFLTCHSVIFFEVQLTITHILLDYISHERMIFEKPLVPSEASLGRSDRRRY